MKPQKRVVLYLNEEEYLELRAKLIIAGDTVSGWLREVIHEYLKKD